MRLEDLKEGDAFQDSELTTDSTFLDGYSSGVSLHIVGDHVYTITNNIDTLVVAHDAGNGNGRVISVTSYN